MKTIYFHLNKSQVLLPKKIKFDAEEVDTIDVQNGHFIAYYAPQQMDFDDSYEDSEGMEIDEEK